MKYSEAIDYLDSKVVLGVKPSLDRISALCGLMGRPQGEYDTIQVTGTNGKTSVAQMMGAILRGCGFSVGVFTSPHLETVRERFSVNGRLIPMKRFAKAMEEIVPLIEKAEKEASGALTYFEVATALAYRYFRSEGVDVAVLEVGLGGRWDATNVVDSGVGVITNIGIDHTGELGRTLKKIAAEKVGIVNEGSVLVTAEVNRDLLMLFSRKCREEGAEMRVFGRDFRLDYLLPYRVPGEPPAQLVSIQGLEDKEFDDIKLPMLGKHQAINAACAVAACQAYTDPREKTYVEAYKKALESCRLHGRMEIMSKRPLVIADGAHNTMGIERLATAITGDFDYSRLVTVASILDDKDARGMLKILGAISNRVVVTENRSARCIPAKRLGHYCRMEGIEHEVEPRFPFAMRLAGKDAGPDGLLCITGSLYTVSEARIYFRHQKESREMRQDR